jgi:hypothetical protein
VRGSRVWFEVFRAKLESRFSRYLGLVAGAAAMYRDLVHRLRQFHEFSATRKHRQRIFTFARTA